MPSAKTYQAIGFATYHGAKLSARRKLGLKPVPPPKRRPSARALAGGGAALALIAVAAAVAAQRSTRAPSV